MKISLETLASGKGSNWEIVNSIAGSMWTEIAKFDPREPTKSVALKSQVENHSTLVVVSLVR